MEVVWTHRATHNLDYFTEKLRIDSGLDDVAEKFYIKVVARSEKLETNPTWIGIEVKEYPGCGYRSLLVMDYRIVYRVEQDTVFIVTFIHKRMLITDWL